MSKINCVCIASLEEQVFKLCEDFANQKNRRVLFGRSQVKFKELSDKGITYNNIVIDTPENPHLPMEDVYVEHNYCPICGVKYD